MRTLTESQDKNTERTKQASDSARQLAFAGIGVVWIFAQGKNGSPGVPPEFQGVLALLCLALLFDLAHYTVAGLLWGIVNRQVEKRKRTEKVRNPEVLAPSPINYPGLFFYYGKVSLVMVSFVWLMCLILAR